MIDRRRAFQTMTQSLDRQQLLWGITKYVHSGVIHYLLLVRPSAQPTILHTSASLKPVHHYLRQTQKSLHDSCECMRHLLPETANYANIGIWHIASNDVARTLGLEDLVSFNDVNSSDEIHIICLYEKTCLHEEAIDI